VEFDGSGLVVDTIRSPYWKYGEEDRKLDRNSVTLSRYWNLIPSELLYLWPTYSVNCVVRVGCMVQFGT